MVRLDIPMPEDCDECPCSYWIRSGEYEGRMMCTAMEFREKGLEKSWYLVDEAAKGRPENCPMHVDTVDYTKLMEEMKSDEC